MLGSDDEQETNEMTPLAVLHDHEWILDDLEMFLHGLKSLLGRHDSNFGHLV